MKIPEALWKKIADDPRTFFRFLQVFDKQQAKLVPFVLN